MLDQAAPALPVFVVDPQIEAFEAQVYSRSTYTRQTMKLSPITSIAGWQLL
jgi:hypothetical protein